MKTGELKGLLSGVPDDFDVEVFHGHAPLAITGTNTAKFGQAFTLHCDDPAGLKTDDLATLVDRYMRAKPESDECAQAYDALEAYWKQRIST